MRRALEAKMEEVERAKFLLATYKADLTLTRILTLLNRKVVVLKLQAFNKISTRARQICPYACQYRTKAIHVCVLVESILRNRICKAFFTIKCRKDGNGSQQSKEIETKSKKHRRVLKKLGRNQQVASQIRQLQLKISKLLEAFSQFCEQVL